MPDGEEALYHVSCAAGACGKEGLHFRGVISCL